MPLILRFAAPTFPEGVELGWALSARAAHHGPAYFSVFRGGDVAEGKRSCFMFVGKPEPKHVIRSYNGISIFP